jgi:hypothetical protein
MKAMRDRWGHEKTHFFQECDMKECAAYLQYKKKSKGDPAMPKDLAARKQCCIKWMSCTSPVASPCQSDDKREVGIGEGKQDAVQELLGMAAFQSDDRYDECYWGDNQVCTT